MNMKFKNNPLVWVLAIVLVSLIAFQLGKKRGAEEAKQPVEKKTDVPLRLGRRVGELSLPRHKALKVRAIYLPIPC